MTEMKHETLCQLKWTIVRDLKAQLLLPLWGFFSEADTHPWSQSPAPDPMHSWNLFFGLWVFITHWMAVFSLNAKQFREVSLQISFILLLLESPIEASFAFSSQQNHICCTICRLWVPLCSFMQPIAQFSQGIKRSNFLHKILDLSLDFSELFSLGLFSHVCPGDTESGISVFDIPHSIS